jgi:hypothetical protein
MRTPYQHRNSSLVIGYQSALPFVNLGQRTEAYSVYLQGFPRTTNKSTLLSAVATGAHLSTSNITGTKWDHIIPESPVNDSK